MRYTIFLALILIISISCNNTNETKKAETTNVVNNTPGSDFNKEGTDKLLTLIKTYYGLKDALVATNATNAKDAAQKLLTATDSFKIFVTTNSSTDSLKIKEKLFLYADSILLQCKNITAINDASCERQRLAFGTISSSLYSLVSTAKLKNAKVYHEFCPMAFNDKGAFWLSNECEIKNPYFGDKMLECGEVTDSL